MRSTRAFVVSRDTGVDRGTIVSLQEMNYLENHLEAWLEKNPDVIEPELRVITTQFGDWMQERKKVRDRLDILAVDVSGTLVIIELKRGGVSDTVELQALKYAAYASSFTVGELFKKFGNYLKKQNEPNIDERVGQLRAVLAARHDVYRQDEKIVGKPRIILMAEDFKSSVTATVWFLYRELGLDVMLLKYELAAFESLPNKHAMTFEKIFPPRDIEEFRARPREQTVADVIEKTKKARRAVSIIIEEEAIPKSAAVYFRHGPQLPELKEQIAQWIADNPNVSRATWTGELSGPIALNDGNVGQPTPMAQRILKTISGKEAPPLNGALWWTYNGKTLKEISSEIDSAIADEDITA